jgi:hypothetical protein
VLGYVRFKEIMLCAVNYEVEYLRWDELLEWRAKLKKN